MQFSRQGLTGAELYQKTATSLLPFPFCAQNISLGFLFPLPPRTLRVDIPQQCHRSAPPPRHTDLHINVPLAPSTLQRKAIIWVLFPASWPQGAGAGLGNLYSPCPSHGNSFVAQEREAEGRGGRAGKRLEGSLGARKMGCSKLFALHPHWISPRGSAWILHVEIHAVRGQPPE